MSFEYIIEKDNSTKKLTKDEESALVKKISSTVTLKEYCTRPTEDLKQELISIQNLKVQKYLKFDKAVVSLKDRIIPPKNQINYWLSQNIKPEEIQGAHSIFDKYENWDDLI